MGDSISDSFGGDEYPRATPRILTEKEQQVIAALEKAAKEKHLLPEPTPHEPTTHQYCCPFCNGYITEKSTYRIENQTIRRTPSPCGPQPFKTVEVKTSTYTCSIRRDNCSILEMYRRSDK